MLPSVIPRTEKEKRGEITFDQLRLGSFCAVAVVGQCRAAGGFWYAATVSQEYHVHLPRKKKNRLTDLPVTFPD